MKSAARSGGETESEPFETVARRSLSGQAYGQIRKALMVGELKPGQKLIGREIAMRLGTSLTPVREALLQLVAEGVLESQPGQPITVPIPTLAVYLELRDLRAEVEGLGAARAAEAAEPDEIAELEQLHATMVSAKAARDFAVALRCNEGFHLGLARASHMPRLFRVVESLWVQSGPFLNFLYADIDGWPVPKTPHAHVRVVDALKQRDAVAARHAIVDDIVQGGTALMRALST